MFVVEMRKPIGDKLGNWFSISRDLDPARAAEYLRSLTEAEKRAGVEYRMRYEIPNQASIISGLPKL